MSYRVVVWHEHGSYGPGGGFAARRNLGTFTLPNQPEAGDILEIGGDDYKVTEVFTGYVYVKPLRTKLS